MDYTDDQFSEFKHSVNKRRKESDGRYKDSSKRRYINILKKNPIGRPRKTRRQDDKANQ